MYNEYPVVIFEVNDDDSWCWHYVFPAIAGAEMSYSIIFPKDPNENAYLIDEAMGIIQKTLEKLIDAYEVPPVPMTIINIMPNEIALSRNILDASKSWVSMVHIETLKI